MRLVIFLASTQGPLATSRLSSCVFCPVELHLARCSGHVVHSQVGHGALWQGLGEFGPGAVGHGRQALLHGLLLTGIRLR